ncbi:hypothetical protein F2P81_024039 [Scophthalmus maximus]|uniref:Uncharacterized protein n=1 Tax=Scophthalmus maximus TaxID=52904 RepID=A0A6A4RSY5_SCOMX|nr:hypothetical protein F2P81_024039 [Scophthalmus maximus]
METETDHHTGASNYLCTAGGMGSLFGDDTDFFTSSNSIPFFSRSTIDRMPDTDVLQQVVEMCFPDQVPKAREETCVNGRLWVKERQDPIIGHVREQASGVLLYDERESSERHLLTSDPCPGPGGMGRQRALNAMYHRSRDEPPKPHGSYVRQRPMRPQALDVFPYEDQTEGSTQAHFRRICSMTELPRDVDRSGGSWVSGAGTVASHNEHQDVVLRKDWIPGSGQEDRTQVAQSDGAAWVTGPGSREYDGDGTHIARLSHANRLRWKSRGFSKEQHDASNRAWFHEMTYEVCEDIKALRKPPAVPPQADQSLEYVSHPCQGLKRPRGNGIWDVQDGQGDRDVVRLDLVSSANLSPAAQWGLGIEHCSDGAVKRKPGASNRNLIWPRGFAYEPKVTCKTLDCETAKQTYHAINLSAPAQTGFSHTELLVDSLPSLRRDDVLPGRGVHRSGRSGRDTAQDSYAVQFSGKQYWTSTRVSKYMPSCLEPLPCTA